MTRKPMTFRCPEELALRLDAAANSDPTRPSVNQLMVVLLEQALDSQQQGKLDAILEEVQLLREDLGRARRLRKARAKALRDRRAGDVVEAKVIP